MQILLQNDELNRFVRVVHLGGVVPVTWGSGVTILIFIQFTYLFLYVLYNSVLPLHCDKCLNLPLHYLSSQCLVFCVELSCCSQGLLNQMLHSETASVKRASSEGRCSFSDKYRVCRLCTCLPW